MRRRRPAAAPRAPRRRRASRSPAASSASGRPARAASATVRPGSSSTRATRTTGTAKIAPIDARTAFDAVRVGGARAERDAAGAERERRAQHRADVAGVVHAPQRDAHRPGRRRRPALRVDRERARARAELGDLLQQVRRDLLARRAPSRPRTAAAPAASPPRAAASIRSSPSATNVRVLSRHLRPASLRTCLSCSLWGLVIGIGRKKRRPSCRGGAPGSAWCRRFSRQASGNASRAASANRRNVSASRTAMSASTLRSISIPASLRPCMNVP